MSAEQLIESGVGSLVEGLGTGFARIGTRDKLSNRRQFKVEVLPQAVNGQASVVVASIGRNADVDAFSDAVSRSLLFTSIKPFTFVGEGGHVVMEVLSAQVATGPEENNLARDDVVMSCAYTYQLSG